MKLIFTTLLFMFLSVSLAWAQVTVGEATLTSDGENIYSCTVLSGEGDDATSYTLYFMINETEGESTNDEDASNVESGDDNNNASGETKTVKIVNETNSSTASVYNNPPASYSGDIIIPSTVSISGQDYTVTEIGDYAFCCCQELTSVELPETVTTIGNHAFYECFILVSINDENIKSISEYSFQECLVLESVNVPEVEKIPLRAYLDCRAINSVTIPATVKEIDERAFSGCSSLESITFEPGSKLTTLGKYSLSQCAFTSIDLPETLVTIGEDAFNNSSLTSITIPSNVTSIGSYAFYQCYDLLEVVCLAETPPTLGTTIPFEKNDGATLYVPAGTGSAYAEAGWNTYFANIYETLNVDDTFTYDGLTYKILTIDEENDSYTVSVVGYTDGLPSELKIPESFNYEYCENSEALFTVTDIADETFSGSSITTVTIPATVFKIGEKAFQSCSSLSDVTIEDGVKQIGPYAFASCTALESIEIPASVTMVEDYAFKYCSSLTSLTMLSKVPPYIGMDVFSSENSSEPSVLNIPDGCYNLYNETTYTIYNQSYNTGNWVSEWSGEVSNNPITSDNGQYYYHYINSDYYNINHDISKSTYTDDESTKALALQLTGLVDNATTLTIPASIYDETVDKTYEIGKIASDAFASCTSLTLTINTSFVIEPNFNEDSFSEEFVGTLIVDESLRQGYAEAGWTEYFMISGYVAIGEEFELDNIKYKVLDGKETVEIVGATDSNITIVESVQYNDLTFTVKSIATTAFADIEDLIVTTDITDPTLISFETYSGDPFGTLKVPDGSLWDFYYSDWATYFTIDGIIGTQFSADNLTYEITDQYNNEVKIVEFNCSESVTIPETVRYSVNKETYTVTAVDANVFASCSSLKEVTMSASEPPFEVSVFTGITEGVVLKVGENQEAYASWHDTFIIYGYVEAGDSFSDDVFTYTVLSDMKTVQITDLQSTATTFGIPTSVTYNGLDFTVKSIADGVFTGKSELKVGVTFTDPSTISIGTIASGNVGTLSVPEGSERNFENSSWSTYFTIANFIEGTQFTESGITYEITDQYTYEVKIVDFYCSESVVIPESVVGYTITAVDSGVFNCSDLISVTMEANTPPFSSSAFSSIGENAILYVDNISAYTTASDNWHNYFTIYGYVEAGDTFSDDIFSYEVLSGTETVEITDIVTTGLSFTINSEVEYNGLTLSIASVDGSIFSGKSDLDVIANFKDPEAPAIDNYNGEKVGTLEVPDGYLYIFNDTNWEKYFDIVGTYLLKNGVQYYFQKDGTADVVGIDTNEKIILTDRVEGFAIETIAESVFEDYLNLEVEITVVNPFSIALEEREDTSIKYGVLTVPDGCNSMYAGTVWADYFVLEGDPYYTDGSGVYYIFHIEVVEVDEDGVEVVSLNKALKATTTEYRITLEVAYVDPDVTEITVPRTIDLGDDSSSSSNSSYEITAMNADALKDCTNLTTINLEAAIPAEDINALNYVPDAVTIVVDEDLGEDYCDSIVKVAEQLNIGVEIKSSSTGIRKIVYTKSDENKVEVERYNLLGQRISAPQRGINIIKYSDGTVEKVLVK